MIRIEFAAAGDGTAGHKTADSGRERRTAGRYNFTMSDENTDANRPTRQLELTKTRLAVEDGELVRRSADDATVTRIPLDDLESCRYVRRFNPMSIAPLLLAIGLAALAYFVSEYNVVDVLLYTAALLVGAFAAFGLFEDIIEVRHRGESLRFECPDPTDEVRGFAVSLNRLLGRG
jgi:hypothetical protein